jgi:alkylation response protein AidB-like acyl-CoA dehydrogenase
MHLGAARVMATIWRDRAAQPQAMVGPTEVFLKAIAAGQLVASIPGTEAGTDISSPMSEVTPTDDGYVLNGRKMFATMSPAAQILFSTARLKREDGGYGTVLCVIPRGTPGSEIIENWDALGMRASGSGEVVYTDCKLPRGSVIPQGDWGVFGQAPLLFGAGFANTLSACFLGIAEAAQQIAIGMAARRKGASGRRMADRVPIQMLIGENEVDLFAARSALERNAREFDSPVSPARDERSTVEGQCMKWIVEHAAINVVNRAMTVSGGAGYMSGHPLSRLYRDVRAGPFMQPFGEYEVMEFIGKSALGIEPPLDR